MIKIFLRSTLFLFALTPVLATPPMVEGAEVFPSPKIVIIDTGYNYLHPELASSYLGGWDFVNNDADPMDDNGHGSHVAGIITADSYGDAPDTAVISGKVLDKEGRGDSANIVRAIYWAVNGPDEQYGTRDDFRADAINVSIASDSVTNAFCDEEMSDLTEAVQYAVSHGVAVVAAAGNNPTAVAAPGCIEKAITVGALRRDESVARFSGRGEAVDLYAAGVGIRSSWLGEEEKTLSGTSMATAVVSARVMKIKKENPMYGVTEIMSTLGITEYGIAAR